MRKLKSLSLFAAACLLSGWLMVACGGGGGTGFSFPGGAAFVVTNPAGIPVVGATVYLIPAGEIDDTPFDGQDILDGTSEDFDEPLEDAVRLRGMTFPQAVTDASGSAAIADVPLGNYFWYVEPAASDAEHLPGGDGCRTARDATTFVGLQTDLVVTSKPPSSATYIGSTSCLACHASYETQANHAHRLGFTVPGQPGPLQDLSRYPDFEDGWNAFLPAATFTGGTVVWYSDYDPTRGFDKFKTSLTDPTPNGETVYVKGHLWRDTAGDGYKITLENVINPGDPRSPWTLTVALTYGGAVYKQRNLVSVPGLNGHYPLLQIQPEGDDSRYDRTRKKYRDYHLDFFWDDTTNVFKDPPVDKAFEGNCTGCHSTGFVRYQDAMTGEWLSGAVDDISGVFDIDGDGSKDEINTGCEACHGPGSAHQQWVSSASNAGPRYIVNPERLSPSREVMICGRCHGRPKGNGPVVTDEPLNPQGLMPWAGISRREYLQEYTTRNGPGTSNYWDELLRSKSHRQQYSDFIKSTMYRNDRILTVCSDCHDSHGDGPFEHQLIYDPENVNSPLCGQCHALDHDAHMLATTGALHLSSATLCTECHMPNTAKSGAGEYGILLGTPTGTSTDPNITYFENDISSHLFLDVARKDNPSVAGVTPGSAMPIPYTNSCGTGCHNASQLRLQVPSFFRGSDPRCGITQKDADDYAGDHDK